jgi:hypothetical protein
MYGGFSSIVIYDSRIFEPGSHVSRWANSVERGFVRHARQEAPVDTGELAAGIHGESFRSGPKHWEVHIHSEAEHTMYVLRGTYGPIRSNRAPYYNSKLKAWINPRMGLRHGSDGPVFKWAEEVRGQRANDFMGRAAERTAVTHSSLRGFHPDYGL